MELLLNDLCFQRLSGGEREGRARMQMVVETIRQAMSHGLSRVLRTTGSVWGAEVSPGYALGKWLADPEVDLELRRYVQSLAGRAPFIEDALSLIEVGDGSLAECKCDHAPVPGQALRLACHTGDPLVSLEHAPWNQDPLTARLFTVTETESTETTFSVSNLYSPSAVAARADWFRERIQSEMSSGVDLVRRAPEVLPSLVFGHEAREQLSAMTGAEKPFRFVVKHLLELQRAVGAWDDRSFEEVFRFACSDETDQTMANYSTSRTFQFPDGTTRTLRLHTKIGVDAWRIYVQPDKAGRRVLVGYVGRHLATVTHRT